MSGLIEDLTAIFEFLFTQLTNIADFFTESDLGRLILTLAIFGLVVNVGISILNKVKGR